MATTAPVLRGPRDLRGVASVVAVVVGMVMVLCGPGPTTAAAEEVEPAPTTMDWQDQPPDGWPQPPPASARSYVLVDALTGQVLASRAADEPRIVASTVKLLTVITALETLDPDDEVVVGDAAAVGGAGTGVDPGETWSVASLVDAVLVRSGNDAALALAQAAGGGDVAAFVEQMQATARDLGLQGATIVEATGLDDGNHLSARHLATLARAALADDRIRTSAAQETVTLPDPGTVENRNLLIGEYPGATGLKTGFTELAGYCLVASAEREGRELVAVVLGAGEDPARFDEAAALLDHGFESLASEAYAPLRARRPGGWDRLLPAGRVWAPADTGVELSLTGGPTRLRLEARVGDETVGTALAEVPTPSSSSVGAALAGAAYAGLRQAHVAGLWPSAGVSGTAAAHKG